MLQYLASVLEFMSGTAHADKATNHKEQIFVLHSNCWNILISMHLVNAH